MSIIKNQKQAALTREKLDDLKIAKVALESKKDNTEPLHFQLGINSFNNLINDLEEQLQAYNEIVSGHFPTQRSDSLIDISRMLIQARLAQGMSQKDLGELLGLKEQQIQRYEAADYETASWVRIVEVATALGIHFQIKTTLKSEDLENGNCFLVPKNLTEEQIKRVENLSPTVLRKLCA